MEMGLSIDQIEAGDKASVSKTISESDVYMFAGITGDFNPVHVNVEYAKETPFNKRIAHGILTAGLISTILGTKLPGPGTIYLKQEISFTAPVYIGDTVIAEVEVMEKNRDKNQLRLRTTCYNQDGKEVLRGVALVMPRRILS